MEPIEVNMDFFLSMASNNVHSLKIKLIAGFNLFFLIIVKQEFVDKI